MLYSFPPCSIRIVYQSCAACLSVARVPCVDIGRLLVSGCWSRVDDLRGLPNAQRRSVPPHVNQRRCWCLWLLAAQQYSSVAAWHMNILVMSYSIKMSSCFLKISTHLYACTPERLHFTTSEKIFLSLCLSDSWLFLRHAPRALMGQEWISSRNMSQTFLRNSRLVEAKKVQAVRSLRGGGAKQAYYLDTMIHCVSRNCWYSVFSESILWQFRHHLLIIVRQGGDASHTTTYEVNPVQQVWTLAPVVSRSRFAPRSQTITKSANDRPLRSAASIPHFSKYIPC